MPKESTITKLRRLIPGEWSYNKRYGYWEHESGFRAYRSAAPYGSAIYRNDTGEPILHEYDDTLSTPEPP